MLPDKRFFMLSSQQAKNLVFPLFIIMLFHVSVVNAADLSVGAMLSNFAQTVPQLMQLITAFAYVMGMFMIFKGLLGLKQYGEARTMMSQQHELKGPLVCMAVGTALLYLPTSIQVGFNTFWSEPNPYGYVNQAQDQWSEIIQDGYLVMQLIGTVAFIRGLILFTHMGSHGQPGTFGKAMMHIIAGIMLINLYGFITVLQNTLYYGQA